MTAPEEPTARRVSEAIARQFVAAGIETARLDARLLVAHVLGVPLQQIMLEPDATLSARQCEALEAVIRRRLAHEPVSRILGRRGFWTLDLEVTAATLDPRPDTETVVEAVLEAMPNHDAPLSILDLGTGSGALLLALLAEYNVAEGVGIDIAPEAVETARRNAADNGISGRASFRVGNWFDGLRGRFDVIVSNPPYIPTADIAGLAPEVRDHDPITALDGGEDGLVAYRVLCAGVRSFLDTQGMVAFEVGVGQAEGVADLLRSEGFDTVWSRQDLGGISRCVCARGTQGRNYALHTWQKRVGNK